MRRSKFLQNASVWSSGEIMGIESHWWQKEWLASQRHSLKNHGMLVEIIEESTIATFGANKKVRLTMDCIERQWQFGAGILSYTF